MVRASFNRPNLHYQVEAKEDVRRQLLAFLRERPEKAGIIYRSTRDAVEKTAAMLTREGLRALPYHAGLAPEVRKANQDAFNRDEVEVVVATVAFGMGIDKSNIRFVVHADLPKNIESYYQETGRSGRDGEPATCLLLFGAGDMAKIRYFIDQVEDDAQRAVASGKLNEMVKFASVNVCRRRQLLGYFGEDFPAADCTGCDVCAGDVEQVDATREARIVLSAVTRTGQRFGAAHVVDVVIGADTQRIRDLGHDRLKTYGAGQDRDKRFWRQVVDHLIGHEFLRRTDDRYPVLQLTKAGLKLMVDGGEFQIFKPRPKPKRRRGRKGAAAPREAVTDYDAVLFDRLRGLRKQLADEQGVLPYIIFSDRSLREMAAHTPAGPAQLREINGVGDVKLKRYGAAFLDAIRDHLGGA